MSATEEPRPPARRANDPSGDADAPLVAAKNAVIARTGPVKAQAGADASLGRYEAAPRISAYSRIVRALRIILPVAALLIVFAVFYSGRGGQEATELVFRTGQFAALQSGLRLTNPRFTGATSAGEPFLLRADWAEPDGPDPKLITMSAISGSIATTDGRDVALTASDGVLRPREQTVTLTGGVSIETSDGYVFETDSLRADAEGRIFESGGAVAGSGPLGELEAGLFRLEGGVDGVIWFENGVTAIIRRVAEPRP